MTEDAGQTPRAEHIAEDAGTEKAAQRDVQSMNARHKRTAQNAQKKAIDALAMLAPEDMTANEARQLLKTAQDIERRITEGRREPERQREDVQALFESVWTAAKQG